MRAKRGFMAKVIQFLILGLIILHFSDASASTHSVKTTRASLKSLVTKEIKLQEFLKQAQNSLSRRKLDLATKVAIIKTFNHFDKNGDLRIDRYEVLMNE